MHSKRVKWATVFVAAGLVLGACGDDDDDDASSDTTEAAAEEDEGDGTEDEAAGDVSGTINISGSSTVEPISIAVAEAFQADNSGVTVNVDGPGTGDGFQLFCSGETDISDASRAISEEEIAQCEEAGIEYVELQVAIDGMAVMTSPDSEGLPACLSFPDLYAIAGPEADGQSNWSDFGTVASELGSSNEFPDADFSMTAPGAESGTYDSFIEIALEGIGEARAEEGAISEDQAGSTRLDYTASADDNVIIQNIEGTPNSFGWVGYAFFEEEQDRLTAFEISEEPGGTCVAPDPETIASGEYPLSRPLFIYVSQSAMADNAAVVPFVDFYVNEGLALAGDVGYVQLNDEDSAATQDAWSSAM